MDQKTKINLKTWNKVGDLFTNGSALPAWGPFSVGENLNLIPKINGKVFLEIGCGSGRSIKYLTDRKARKVYGIDFSKNQVEEAKKYNIDGLKRGKVEIIQSAMEEKIKIEPIDVAYSVYGIGWTHNPQKTFSNIYSYLKPKGLFIWSWDHSFFKDVSYEDNKLVVHGSYHNENPTKIKDWKKKGCQAFITYRKVSNWFKLLKDTDFDIVAYYEPAPEDLNRAHDDPKKYYSLQKASKVPSTFIFVCQK